MTTLGSVLRRTMVNKFQQIKDVEEEAESDVEASVQEGPKLILNKPAGLLGSIVNRTMVEKLARIKLVEPQ